MRDPRIISFEAAAAIRGRRLVAGAGAGSTVREAAAGTDKIVGAAAQMGADAAGDMADVVVDGPVEVVFGGNVSAFDPITADAQGRAVVAAPGAGVTHRIAGFALVDGVVGDIGRVQIAPSLIKG